MKTNIETERVVRDVTGVQTTCDICQAEVIRSSIGPSTNWGTGTPGMELDGVELDVVTITRVVGAEKNPETVWFDICGACFETHLAEAMANMGAKPYRQ